MATIVSGQYQQPAQNSSQLQAPVTSNQDPLFEALVNYTRSSADGQGLSEGDVQKYYQQIISAEDGSTYLASLTGGAPTDALGRRWKEQGNVNLGKVDVTTSTLTFNFNVPGLALQCKGSTNNILKTATVQLGGAILFYNDPNQLRDTACDFKIDIKHPQNRESILFIDFSDTNGKLIASLQKKNTYILLPPNLAGSALFSAL